MGYEIKNLSNGEAVYVGTERVKELISENILERLDDY